MQIKRKPLSKKQWGILIGSAVFLAFLFAALDCRLLVRTYEIDAEEINDPIRIALVTDLHSCYYGKNQSTLLNAIDARNPDLVLLGGDIYDDVLSQTNADLFVSRIASQYPCYYVTGNHETVLKSEAYHALLEKIRSYGVQILENETVQLTFGTTTINLCGILDNDYYRVYYYMVDALSFAEQIAITTDEINNDNYTLLLSHRPAYFPSDYQGKNIDLILSGHTHGGQVRIPYLLNGLFAPHEDWFPKYGGGRYDIDDTTMIISRGLARESTPVPRVFNRPELVIVDLS